MGEGKIGFCEGGYTVERMLNIVSLNRNGRATINLKALIVIMVISLALSSLPVASVPPVRGRMREPTLRHGRGNDRGHRAGVGRPLQPGFQLLVDGHGGRTS